jgi:hypothetical protein
MQKSMENDSVNSNRTISICWWSFQCTSGWNFWGSHHRQVGLCIGCKSYICAQCVVNLPTVLCWMVLIFFLGFLILSKKPYLTRPSKINRHCSFGPLCMSTIIGETSWLHKGVYRVSQYHFVLPIVILMPILGEGLVLQNKLFPK